MHDILIFRASHVWYVCEPFGHQETKNICISFLQMAGRVFEETFYKNKQTKINKKTEEISWMTGETTPKKPKQVKLSTIQHFELP